jgi:hypothetical protein
MFSCWYDLKQLNAKLALAKHLVIDSVLTSSHTLAVYEPIHLWTGDYWKLLQRKLLETSCTVP